MKRRQFIAVLGSTAAWPLVARAQQGEQMRRVGALMFGSEEDPEYHIGLRALREGLQTLGWIEGRNLRMDLRFGDGDLKRLRAHAEELVKLAPDVIVVTSGDGTRTVQQLTRTIPIIFLGVGDPVKGGLVKSIARPEGNATGFTNKFDEIRGKWLELMKEAAPRLARVALLFNAQISSTDFSPYEGAAATLGLTAIRTPFHNAEEIERAIVSFAAEPNGGLVVLPPNPTAENKELIIRLAIQHRLPTIYQTKSFTTDGGMMSYGSDPADVFRNASTYVDRILRGAKPGDLPVQFPTKLQLVVNLKTAKAIGLTIPETLLATADEVIQ
jgi:putative tryptophan/tyrosine transport system substrate-binding protein